MGNSPGFSFLLSETPPAAEPEPVRPAEAARPGGDGAPAVRKVQFPKRLAQSVSDRPPGARLADLDDEFDDAFDDAPAPPGAPAPPAGARFTSSDVPPDDLPILREPEADAAPGLAGLSAALLSRLRRTKDAEPLEPEPMLGGRHAPGPRPPSAERLRPEGAAPAPRRPERTFASPSNAAGGTFGRAVWEKTRAPLAALCAAGVFYIGGTELIGRTQIALSKPSVPDVPELGTLESAEGSSNPKAKDAEDAARAEGEGTTTAPASRERAPLTTELVDLPPGLSWPGKGLVEVVTPEDELIYVDGVFIGRGPLRRIPLAPGEHEVWIQKDAVRQAGKVQVVLDRSVRAVFAFR